MRKLLFIFAAVLLSSIGLHAGTQITYKAWDRLSSETRLEEGATTFGPKIVSHTFSDNIGVITCDGEITKIGTDAFFRCSTLNSIEIPSSVIAIEQGAFDACKALTSIVIPNSVTTIGTGAFNVCSKLAYVTIGNSVTSIFNEAFAGCESLTYIEIPGTVTSIGPWAFNSCSALTKVKVNWTDAQSIIYIQSNVFRKIANGAGPSGATLYVPKGTIDLYRQADGWKDFGSITDDFGNTITYTASAQLTGTQFNTGVITFGSPIVSHTFNNGVGAIVCEGPITTIGERAFYECKNLISVTIPNAVTTIGEKAFYICSGLTSMTIPKSVTTIGETAFEGSSTSLTSIVVESGNSKYDSRDNCNAIIETATNTLILGCKNTKIPNNITTIGRSAFDGCYDLKDITIPNSVTAIRRSAFWECKSLTSITIPNAVTTIGMNAFARAGLTSIAIPASVQEINEHAFWNCTNLKSVTVAWTNTRSIVSINDNVFERVANGAGPSGATLYVPVGTYYIYKQANVWNNFIIEVPNSTITYTASAQLPGYNGSLAIGATTFGEPIVSHTFSNGVGRITCAGPITTIKDEAFRECSSLISIEIPSAVSSIGEWPFLNCPNLSTIVVDSGNKTYDSRDNCNAIIEKATNTLIYGCKNTVIPNTVTAIGEDAFRECSSLTSITIPNSVTSIGRDAFQSCTNLLAITIPSSVTSIDKYVFTNCTSLSTIVVESGNTTYDSRNNCNAIIEKATNTLIYGCKSTVIPNTVTSIGEYAFSYCSGLPSIDIPHSVTTLKNYAFFKCHGLTSVNIPNSVTTIGDGVFRECQGLTSVTIPSSVKTIGTYVFCNCSILSSVTVSWLDQASIVPIGNDVFHGIANGAGARGATLYVPGGAIDIYKQVDVWKDFGSAISPNCLLTYTASAQLPGYDGSLSVGATTFGAPIVSHTFSGSKGVITCAGEITMIGGFRGCSDLRSIAIPNTVTVITNYAFSECSNLTSIDIPNSVTTIVADAFSYCSSLKNVTLPNSITFIGIRTFCECSSLTSIDIPKTVTRIQSYAFNRCTSLTTMYCRAVNPPFLQDASSIFQGVPRSNFTAYVYDPAAYQRAWATRPSSCFKSISAEIGDLKYEFFDGNKARVVAMSSGCKKDTIIIPEQVVYDGITFTVTEIGPDAFHYYLTSKPIASVTMPNTITVIGANAFRGCKDLTSIDIPSSVVSIGQSAFELCTGLVYVSMGDAVTSIGNFAFYDCTNLELINISASATEIGEKAFKNCKSLKYIISMPEFPPTLADGAFEGYNQDNKVIVYVPSLSAISDYKRSTWANYFTNFVTSINYEKTSSTTVKVVSAVPVDGKIYIPTTVLLEGTYYKVTGIGDGAFSYLSEDNEDLQSIDLPPTMQYIENKAFYRCTKLSKLVLPEDLQVIGDSAFLGCSALDSIVIPDGVYRIGKMAFRRCSALNYVHLSDSLLMIEEGCFRECPLGKEIVVPEGVALIGEWAYQASTDAKTAEITISLPSTLEQIESYAFYDRDKLKEVVCRAINPPTLGTKVFTHQDTALVYAPNRDAIQAYKKEWGSYPFKFTDLMAEENKQYLHFVADTNQYAQAIANAYCDSINRATTTQQVQYYTNIALAMMDKYTLNDYKKNLANQLDSLANNNPDAMLIAEEYRKKLQHALFREEAERIFAEGCAKIKAVFELIDFKIACCNNLRGSVQEEAPELKKVAEDYCTRILLATTKEEVNKIYQEGAQEIAMYVHRLRYWSGSPDKDCQTTTGYYE